MKQYEAIILFSDKLTETKYNEIVDKYTQIITDDLDSTLEKPAERLGKRKLAYDVKGCKSAWYLLFTFNTDPEKVADLESMLRADSDVIKFLVIKLDDEVVAEEKREAVETPTEVSSKSNLDPISEQDSWDLIFGGV